MFKLEAYSHKTARPQTISAKSWPSKAPSGQTTLMRTVFAPIQLVTPDTALQVRTKPSRAKCSLCSAASPAYATLLSPACISDRLHFAVAKAATHAFHDHMSRVAPGPARIAASVLDRSSSSISSSCRMKRLSLGWVALETPRTECR